VVLPQDDRTVLVVDPKLGIKSFEDLLERKLAFRIAMSTNDGTNFIGYVAASFIEAHSTSEEP
jgi:uncharacterized protein